MWYTVLDYRVLGYMLSGWIGGDSLVYGFAGCDGPMSLFFFPSLLTSFLRFLGVLD